MELKLSGTVIYLLGKLLLQLEMLKSRFQELDLKKAVE